MDYWYWLKLLLWLEREAVQRLGPEQRLKRARIMQVSTLHWAEISENLGVERGWLTENPAICAD